MITVEYLYQLFQKSSGVCTDTRNITSNCIFFALKGGNFNGNLFAEEALEKGALFAVVDEPVSENESVFLVKDVLKALQDVANHHRKQLKCPVLGITGTNGKTTTKELIYAVLSTEFKTYATKGNLNNHIGVPLTLLSIPVDAEMAIVEMGANKPGDIQELCGIAEPNLGIVTNVGKAHLEGFGSFEGVKKTKGEMYDFVGANKGVVFVNGNNSHLLEMLSGKNAQVIEFLTKASKTEVTLVSQTPYITFKLDDGEEQLSHLIGEYNFENIAAAYAIANYLGVKRSSVEKALRTYESFNNRSQVKKAGTNTLLLDAYNANPTSMRAAVLNMKNIAAAKKIVVLGDMFELGDYTKEEHAVVIQLVKEQAFDLAVFCGEHFKTQEVADEKMKFFKTASEAGAFLKELTIDNTLILLKGSRGMKLEQLVELF